MSTLHRVGSKEGDNAKPFTCRMAQQLLEAHFVPEYVRYQGAVIESLQITLQLRWTKCEILIKRGLLDVVSSVTSTNPEFVQDVVRGLRQEPKELPCKYLYDQRGSELFDEICELDAYYPTRTEMRIMRKHVTEMAALIGTRARLIEYGSGSSTKTTTLLDGLRELAGYVPIDISREHLRATVRQLRRDYPQLDIQGIAADYHQDFVIPAAQRDVQRNVIYYPGSTIGNIAPEEAGAFLHQMALVAGPHGGLLIGVDLVKERSRMELAYNDPEGVTAAFNLNLLHRINREADGDFQADRFEHQAVFNEQKSRIEMHLVAIEEQQVCVGGQRFSFAAGESIHTENSYKYTIERFQKLASTAGWQPVKVWQDSEQLFSVHYLQSTAR